MKLQAKDLRIGNLLRMAGTDYVVSSIHSDNTIRFKSGDSCIGCFSTRLFKPIPLTEEWLVKMGFVWDNKKVYLCINSTAFRIRYSHNQLTLFQRCRDVTVPNIKHVHQLQNLYHALTGEELTIKE